MLVPNQESPMPGFMRQQQPSMIPLLIGAAGAMLGGGDRFAGGFAQGLGQAQAGQRGQQRDAMSNWRVLQQMKQAQEDRQYRMSRDETMDARSDRDYQRQLGLDQSNQDFRTAGLDLQRDRMAQSQANADRSFGMQSSQLGLQQQQAQAQQAQTQARLQAMAQFAVANGVSPELASNAPEQAFRVAQANAKKGGSGGDPLKRVDELTQEISGLQEQRTWFDAINPWSQTDALIGDATKNLAQAGAKFDQPTGILTEGDISRQEQQIPGPNLLAPDLTRSRMNAYRQNRGLAPLPGSTPQGPSDADKAAIMQRVRGASRPYGVPPGIR